jgi:hypothetical protein
MKTWLKAWILLNCLKLSALFLSSPRLCRTQRVVGDIHSITLEIETAGHDISLTLYSSTFRQLIFRNGRPICFPSLRARESGRTRPVREILIAQTLRRTADSCVDEDLLTRHALREELVHLLFLKVIGDAIRSLSFNKKVCMAGTLTLVFYT